MNKCFYCGNECVELRAVSIDIAGEPMKCSQCSECNSVILSEDDINKINERYNELVEEKENLQDEFDNYKRLVKVNEEQSSDEDVNDYINSKNEQSLDYAR